MRKILLFAAMICCMMPVMAQKNNDKTPAQQMKETKQKVEQINTMTRSYTQKLDSIVEPGSKEIMQYDQHLNCIKNTLYYTNGTSWDPNEITEYEYDNQNRVISATYTTVGSEEYASRETIVYDAQGRISEIHDWSKVEGTWMEVHKMTVEYNAQGELLKESMYGKDDNNEWYLSGYWEYNYENGLLRECLGYNWSYVTGNIEPNNRSELFYDGQLCTREDYSVWDLDNHNWVINYRTEYMYNGDGLVKEEIFMHTYEYGGELEYSTRTQYEYDDHHNVTLTTNYRYEEGWELEVNVEMEYDLTVLASNIAGFAMRFGNDPNSYYKNKLVKITTTNSYNESEVMIPYYSAAAQIGEIAESLLTIWPNPVSETLNLNGDMSQVQIFSMDGRLVMTLEEGTKTVDVNSLATGCYLLKATLKDGRTTSQTFVKQ